MIPIHDIRTWSPGTLMRMDVNGFVAFGLVVSNDGKHTVEVVWDQRCYVRFRTYDVRTLSPIVVSRAA